MNKEKLEWRMYGLVPYNLSPIQQGIQFGHAVQGYNNIVMQACSDNTENFYTWAHEDKTVIILNGGTTNNNYKKGEEEDGKYKGSLNNHLMTLMKNDIEISVFNEPDLGDQLTAVVFLVEERVWDTENYPDFKESVYYLNHPLYSATSLHNPVYKKWVTSIGGEKNVFLREFLKEFKLA